MKIAKREWSIVKVPYGGGYSSLNLAKTPNTRNAPLALEKEFKRQRVFMADNGTSSWDNIPWLKIPLKFFRQNNVDGWERMHKSVVSSLKILYQEREANILFLGGSHTVTVSTYTGVSNNFGRKQTGLIVFDAHPDCCHKANWPVHSDWLRWLVEDECILPQNILVFGLRQIEKAEKEFLDKFGISYFYLNSVRNVEDRNMHYFSAMRALEKLQALEAIYLSVDIDAASGVYAPGTGCPSPGGFTDRELIGFIKQFKTTLLNLKAADIVEINPLKRWQKRILRYDATVDLGVKLIKEIIS